MIPASTSCSIALSNVRSATNCFSLAFSTCSRRFTCSRASVTCACLIDTLALNVPLGESTATGTFAFGCAWRRAREGLRRKHCDGLRPRMSFRQCYRSLVCLRPLQARCRRAPHDTLVMIEMMECASINPRRSALLAWTLQNLRSALHQSAAHKPS